MMRILRRRHGSRQRTKDSKILPEQLLAKEDVLKILRVAEHPMHKAIVIVGHDLGGRPNEWFTMRIKDVDFDEYSAIVRVKGKNGSRRVRVVLATASLRQWLQIHPHRDDSNAPLWVCLEGKHAGEALGYERIIVGVPNQHALKRYAEACQRHRLEPTTMAKLLSCFHAKT